jgi:xylulokinase
MATYLLGIDVSTTATKALLIDPAGRVVAAATTEYPFETPHPLWSEQDAGLFWDGTVASVRAVLAQSGDAPADIAGVGLTGQMHGLVALDAAGVPLRPCILWNDQRTAAQCEEITRRLGPASSETWKAPALRRCE